MVNTGMPSEASIYKNRPAQGNGRAGGLVTTDGIRFIHRLHFRILVALLDSSVYRAPRIGHKKPTDLMIEMIHVINHICERRNIALVEERSPQLWSMVKQPTHNYLTHTYFSGY